MKITSIIKLFFKIVFICLLLLATVKTYHKFTKPEETFKSYPYHGDKMLD